MEISFITNKGLLRKNNEDSLLINQDVFSLKDLNAINKRYSDSEYNHFFIADGLGGEEKGEIASWMVLNHLSTLKFDNSNSLIYEISRIKEVMDEYSKIHSNIVFGTTLAGIVIHKYNSFILNIGDTRIYLIRGTSIKQLSIDHTVAQEEVERGFLNKQELRNHPARNFLTSSISGSSNVKLSKINTLNLELKESDIILILSDGVWEQFTDDELFAIFSNTSNIEISVKNLYISSYVNSKDNLSIIAVKV